MILVFYKLIAALLIFLSSILIMIYPLRTKGKIKHNQSFVLGESLASGIFLGVAFFHLLPNAISIFEKLYPTVHYPWAEVICIIGFLYITTLHHIQFHQQRHNQEIQNPMMFVSLTFGIVLMGVIAIWA